MPNPYFSNLGDFLYVNRTREGRSEGDYSLVKNLFKRAKLREDIYQDLTFFTKYDVLGDDRPDNVADLIYGDPTLDWVVLISNNITNVRDEWPLEHNDFNSYLLDKYLTEQNISSIHHHETIKIIDEEQKIVLNESLQVDSNFSFSFVGSVVSSSGSLIEVDLGGTSVSKINPVRGITNYQYEAKLNDEKRRIKVLKPEFITAFITDHREIMAYDESSDFITKDLKGTYNPRISGV